jgi:hypothetical protein
MVKVQVELSEKASRNVRLVKANRNVTNEVAINKMLEDHKEVFV